MNASPVSFDHVESLCPQCGYKMNASTHVHGESASAPVRGDVSVCINCGQVLTYEDGGRLRLLPKYFSEKDGSTQDACYNPAGDGSIDYLNPGEGMEINVPLRRETK